MLRVQRQATAAGYGHLASQSHSIICDYDLEAIAKQNGAETIAVAIGSDEVEPALEYCLALGIDRAVKLDPGRADYSQLDEAKMLQSYLKNFDKYTVVFGYNSALHAINAVAPMLASLLECRQQHMVFDINVNSCTVKHRNGAAIVETMFKAPVVITMNTSRGQVAAATLYDLAWVNAKQIESIAMPVIESSRIALSYKKERPAKSCQALADMEDLHGLLKSLAVL